jgi:hypothetical protein
MRDVTIHGVSPELFKSVKGFLLGHFEGRELIEDKEIHVKGVRASYSYHANSNSLTVSITNTPDIVTAGYALGQLYDALDRLGVKKSETP